MSEQLPDATPMVTITYPDPSVGDARVPAASVGHWRNAGWDLAPDQDTSRVEELPVEVRRFEGQGQVRLYHPALDRTETFAESAVPHWRSKGWVPADQAVTHAAAQEAAAMEELTVEELKDRVRAHNEQLGEGAERLSLSGTKAELLERLRGVTEQQPQPAEQPPVQPAVSPAAQPRDVTEPDPQAEVTRAQPDQPE